MRYILAADDEPANRDIIEEVLKDEYEVVCVEDGLQCIESITQRIPDLLLLDVAMPKMDGIEVCKTLRADEKTNQLPIILFSGFAAKEHIDKGMLAGADKYITKPYLPSQLRAIIREMFEQK